MLRLLIFACILNAGFANIHFENVDVDKSQGKIYVDLRDLVSSKDGFWFQLPGYSFALRSTSLQWDSNGPYLNAQGVEWICSKCRAYNSDLSNPICQNCGHNRFED